MKKILITGANSYVGGAVKARLSGAGYSATVLDMLGDGWRAFDFSGYDSVFHVAGIAHLKEKRRNKDAYFAVNAKLPVEVAQKAKAAGVKQFIFMSSMSVYAGYGNANITEKTPFKPKGYYGHSKLKADTELQAMQSPGFNVAVLRPPMIFGKDCKGNFTRLKSLAARVPIFPKIKNRRSMLHIDNLAEFVKLVIDNGSSGVFFPQNPDYFCTSDLVKSLAAASGKKLRLTPLFNWAVWLLYPFMPPLRKLFGSLTYDPALSADFQNAYQVKTNAASVEASV
ncbi:MAG: NAD-dependent epimerase/dehydratase family protein [Clostridiales bacterium]|jgi:UDP-glucose 4-epimerase|nr:NAD-dependent epimerase/dehydratase family protein [Clostridiales bacterium]